MPFLSRLILLTSAVLCGGFFALSGAGVSWALEPDQYSTATVVFWVFAGGVLGMPFWLPAVFPSRYVAGLELCRRICAGLLLLPTWLFGSIVVHNFGRIVSGGSASPVALVQGSVLTACCLVSLFVLLLPELRRYAPRKTKP
ncbi:MAG: hypothetical protein HXY26_01780 [Hydrogenophilaceae bacterium]|nr:hypothetical protein [Hydrogenophilaceae bacterium]